MEFTYEFIVGHPHENFIIYKNTDRIYYFIDNIEKLAFRLPQSPPNMSPDAKKKNDLLRVHPRSCSIWTLGPI